MEKSIDVLKQKYRELDDRRVIILNTKSYLHNCATIGTNSVGTRDEYVRRLKEYHEFKEPEVRAIENEMEALEFYIKQIEGQPK